MIGLESYDNGPKNTWRGWQWNRIIERLPEFTQRSWLLKGESATRAVCATKTVLYLCGPEDSDRSHLYRRGFREENIIAVDVTESNVASVRRNGGLAISAPLEDIIANWPHNWPLDIIAADLCCGLGDLSQKLAFAMFASGGVGKSTVVSVNLQRGRDQSSNSYRELCQSRFSGTMQQSDVKHRGAMWAMLCYDIWSAAWYPWIMRQYGGSYTKDQLVKWAAETVERHCEPVFQEYRASRVVMDSCVIRWPPFMYLQSSTSNDRTALRAAFRESAAVIYRELWPIVHKTQAAIKAKVAALRAVRTMKLQKQGI